MVYNEEQISNLVQITETRKGDGTVVLAFLLTVLEEGVTAREFYGVVCKACELRNRKGMVGCTGCEKSGMFSESASGELTIDPKVSGLMATKALDLAKCRMATAVKELMVQRPVGELLS
ncbi:hypothetical protein A2899_00920 [Candidatus Amesbacteria bacterium RIFCSPLOWO2_01_FULL_49_25]|uniref:Uncharacterized protein n=1 Tax=Candidatus Amesbacteria bacterium RIFCSPHIGHO2_01_FULL_48_32b TaxID=1797253 RepID=A0A1F4YHP0_9BACT|nr:MAG: hypothetical protein A2876_00070 [Candidatus Amesbacteria bacterium RIFCSPHIGHO2_01_FULL_48_32b]OGD07128.1 MAG: hypothetical protein A2899_00920 [Candidatus Amesbacteria bacterium RIFCSPLOWO2_01_FULL_49_25]